MSNDIDHLLAMVARAKYAEVQALSVGPASGRRLELSFAGATPELIKEQVLPQLIDIGRRLGTEFLMNSPAVMLEQFSIMAIMRNEDTAGLISSLLNGFMLAYMTPETVDGAVTQLNGLSALRREIAVSRGVTPWPMAAHPNPHGKH